MLKIASLVLVAILSSCSAVPSSQFRLGGITDEQIKEITPVIRAQTSERILGFKRLPNGTVQVKTGNRGQQGIGGFYYVRKVGGKWKIVEESVWDA